VLDLPAPPRLATTEAAATAPDAVREALALIGGWAEVLAGDASLPDYARQAARRILVRSRAAARFSAASTAAAESSPPDLPLSADTDVRPE
jgi:hypothetical protein